MKSTSMYPFFRIMDMDTKGEKNEHENIGNNPGRCDDADFSGRCLRKPAGK